VTKLLLLKYSSRLAWTGLLACIRDFVLVFKILPKFRTEQQVSQSIPAGIRTEQHVRTPEVNAIPDGPEVYATLCKSVGRYVNPCLLAIQTIPDGPVGRYVNPCLLAIQTIPDGPGTRTLCNFVQVCASLWADM